MTNDTQPNTHDDQPASSVPTQPSENTDTVQRNQSFHDFNQRVIEEFRANNGRVGGPFENARLILLTTTGARTGQPHTTPVGYLPDTDGRMLVIASAGGAPKHPAWYHNLLANPRATVEDGTFTLTAEATVLEGEERDVAFARAVEADPGWGEYQDRTGRVIPVVALTPVDGGPNTMAWGDGLKAIHDAFRRELALVRAEVAAAGPRLGAQLRINCLTVCQGVHFHHTMEDGNIYPMLDERNPELAPALERMREEHKAIAGLLDELQALVSADGAGDGAGAGVQEAESPVDPAVVLAEVDRLVNELEAHLDHEEEVLVPVLNAMSP